MRITAMTWMVLALAAGANPSEQNTPQSADGPPIPDGLYVRIRPLSNRGDRRGLAHWDPTDYNAQQILSLIAELKPNVLERYTDGRLDPTALVPVAEGQPPMTVVEFLNASMRGGAPGCVITPRLSLNEYDMGTFFDTAQSLYGFPVDPPMRILSLDNWKPFAPSHTPEQVRDMFLRLREQGWRRIAVNLVGGIYDPQGFASIVEVGVKKQEGFAPDREKLKALGAVPGVEKRLLYIDFPGQTNEFMKLDPDERARKLEEIAAAQEREGYTFVWPILQGAWDSARVFTSPSGPYRGQSLYDVMKAALRGEGERQAATPAGARGGRSF
ncbi:MAG: hypothetical protein NTW86_14095 [Candidatus Sumerlaeota bacterium]|nr:hypothetical protein [Candidatus Sumerlaeota bacterium]